MSERAIDSTVRLGLFEVSQYCIDGSRQIYQYRDKYHQEQSVYEYRTFVKTERHRGTNIVISYCRSLQVLSG